MGSSISKIKKRIPFLSKKREKKSGFDVVSRAEWGARVPRWREDLAHPALSAAVEYTGTAGCATREECTREVQNIQNRHMDRDNLPDIQYSFLIGGDGTVFEGRGWQTLTNRNTKIKCVDPEGPPPPAVLNKDEQANSPDRRIVIAFIGEESDGATEAMNDAVSQLIRAGIADYYLAGDPHPDDLDDEVLEEILNYKTEEGGDTTDLGEEDKQIMRR